MIIRMADLLKKCAAQSRRREANQMDGKPQRKNPRVISPSDALANFNDYPSLPFRGRLINRMSIPRFSTTVEFLALALK
jgi:hypothetical protein